MSSGSLRLWLAQDLIRFRAEGFHFLFHIACERGGLALDPVRGFSVVGLRLHSVAETVIAHRQEKEVVRAATGGASLDARFQRRYGIGELSEPVINHAESVQLIVIG